MVVNTLQGAAEARFDQPHAGATCSRLLLCWGLRGVLGYAIEDVCSVVGRSVGVRGFETAVVAVVVAVFLFFLFFGVLWCCCLRRLDAAVSSFWC